MLVQTNSLTKRFGPLVALDACNLNVERAEVFGLLGPNGAGKTTLLRLLLGYLRPTSGGARIDGLDCYRQSVAVHRKTSYLPGDVRLFRQMRGRDVLEFFVAVRPGVDRQRALGLAGRLELDLARPVARMSTGMRQKLALAAVLAADTSLVVLDEPTSNLDPTVRGVVLALVAEAKSAGRTVIFSSHVLSEVEQACDRVAILSKGRLAHVQNMSQLRRQHRIRARLTAELPPVPAGLAGSLSVARGPDGSLTIDTPNELAPLLGWLATLPLADLRIEPIGLRALYDQFHAVDEL